MSTFCRFVIGLSLFWWSGCSSGGTAAAPAEPPPAAADPAPAAEPAPAAAPAPEAEAEAEVDPSAPASMRMRGSWVMRLQEVDDRALTPELRKLKRDGIAKMIGFEYTIDESRFDVVQRTPRGVQHKSWYYEVIEEDGDKLELKRRGEDGLWQHIHVYVRGDELQIGDGVDGAVTLHRVKRADP